MISTLTVVGLDTLSSRFAQDIMNRLHFDTKHRVIGRGHSKKTKINTRCAGAGKYIFYYCRYMIITNPTGGLRHYIHYTVYLIFIQVIDLPLYIAYKSIGDIAGCLQVISLNPCLSTIYNNTDIYNCIVGSYINSSLHEPIDYLSFAFRL